MKKTVKKQQKMWIKLNNAGSALLTVIVVVAFITVLATTMLYVTGMNYQMKQTDYQNKKSFYKAEEALDGLKAELAKEYMSPAFQYAYQEVMVQYANLESDERQATFNGAFLKYLDDEWKEEATRRTSMSQTLNDKLKEMVASAGYDSRCFIEPAGEDPIELVCDRSNGRYVIKNIRVRYAENGYSSFICTDIAFCVPDLDLTHNGSSNHSWTASSPDREAVVLTDYIIYMNWTKY